MVETRRRGPARFDAGSRRSFSVDSARRSSTAKPCNPRARVSTMRTVDGDRSLLPEAIGPGEPCSCEHRELVDEWEVVVFLGPLREQLIGLGFAKTLREQMRAPRGKHRGAFGAGCVDRRIG